MAFMYRPRFHGCCCCFDLRAGSLIILWMSLILWILYPLSVICIPFDPDYRVLWIVSTYLAVFYLIIPAALGIYGAHKNKPDFLLPWIVIYTIHVLSFYFCFVILVILWIVSREFVHDFFREHHFTFGDVIFIRGTVDFIYFIFIFCLLITNMVHWYYLNVVRSFYAQLKYGFGENSSA